MTSRSCALCCVFASSLLANSAFAAEQLLADFEGPDYAGWTATGTAFGLTPARGALPNQQNVGGFRGQGLVNSYLGGDAATGTLTSPEFTVSQRYLNFLLGGGAHEGQTCVNVLVGGQVVRSAPGRDDEFLNMATLDLGDFLGKPARIQVVDTATGGWGHINADHFVLSDTAATPPVKARTIDTSRLYDETFRPQFHFTAQKGWLNDPNGLVHFAGEYHLFFQHNPYGREWGNMTWGHAVSPDLIHWQQLDHALWPDRMGTMFSGSAVVDWQNTAGFQTGKEPALVAIYTAAGGTSEESKGQPFTQCLAYSNDRGRTWTKYAGNPVVPNVGDGDRDPKVFWHVPTKRWVMPLYVGEKDPVKKDAKGNPTTRHVCHFYTSPDLKVWSFASKFAEELYECPGFFELPVDGHKGRSKWVLFGANGDYWLGRFDGSVFAAESPKLKGDYGANAYAAQAFDDLPDRRVVLVNWMNGGKYPGMPFNQQMGVPLELSLQTTPEGIRLVKWPAKELGALAAKADSVVVPLKAGTHALPAAAHELLDLELEFQPGQARTVTLELRGQKLTWDAQAGELTVFGRKLPLRPAGRGMGRHTEKPWNNSVRLRVLLDRTSLEVFGNGGVAMASFCFVPPVETGAALTIAGGDLAKARLTVTTLKSAWR
jgi:sucrose-6-phosphate hydrolase SacC (GH32 family)